jgi:hypothetical protein
MAAAVQAIKDGRDLHTTSTQANMNGKIVASYITNETANYNYKTDKNLELKFDKLPAYMGSVLVAISNGGLTPGTTAQIAPMNAVRLAAIENAPQGQSPARFRCNAAPVAGQYRYFRAGASAVQAGAYRRYASVYRFHAGV